jgi:hypothetical protein
MTENAFRRGDRVLARTAHNNWYKGVIDGVETSGNYLVRWAPQRTDNGLPVISSIEPENIRPG